MIYFYDDHERFFEHVDALCWAWTWTRRIVILVAVMLLCSCSYTNCTFTTARLSAGGCMEADVRQVPLDKSTTGAVTATHTVSPTATVTGIPGM